MNEEKLNILTEILEKSNEVSFKIPEVYEDKIHALLGALYSDNPRGDPWEIEVTPLMNEYVITIRGLQNIK